MPLSNLKPGLHHLLCGSFSPAMESTDNNLKLASEQTKQHKKGSLLKWFPFDKTLDRRGRLYRLHSFNREFLVVSFEQTLTILTFLPKLILP